MLTACERLKLRDAFLDAAYAGDFDNGPSGMLAYLYRNNLLDEDNVRAFINKKGEKQQ